MFERNKKKLISEVFYTYGYLFCEKCGRSDKPLEVHHIIFRSEAPDHPELHSLKNLMLVCRDCHNKAHRTNKNEFRKELIKARELDKIFTFLKPI